MFNYLESNGEPNIGKIIRHSFTGLLLIILFFGSFGIIGPQERGIKVRLGHMVGFIESGPYVKWPLIESVRSMDVKTQSLVTTKDAPMSASSNDQQDVHLAITVNYHVDPSNVANIYQQYGSDEAYYSNVVQPQIVATVKATASQYTAAEQIQKRQEMADKMLAALQASFEGKSVTIEKADITDIDFTPEYKASIEKKVVAVQDAETAKNKLVQVQAEADQRIAQAKGEAEAIRIQAAAIQSQGGENYVQLKTIEKWNGVGCSSYCGLQTSTGLLVTGK